jgi:hypothetical protein
MSKNIIKKALIISTITVALLSTIGYLLFAPFINIRKSIGLDDPRYSSQEIVVNSYNPFTPRISLITQVEDGYLVTVEDYTRSGLQLFTSTGKVNDTIKGDGFDSINSKVTGKTLEETIEIVKQKDQSTNPFTPEISQLEKDYKEEQKKPVECQKVYLVSKEYDENELSFINKNTKYYDEKLQKFEGEVFRNQQKIYFLSININSDKIIKYNVYFGEINPALDESVTVVKLEKVFSDCTTEEIPLPEAPLQ